MKKMDVPSFLPFIDGKKLKKTKTLKQKSLQYNGDKQYWRDFIENIENASQSPEEQSRKILSVLPQDVYKSVCGILNIPILSDSEPDESKEHSGPTLKRITKSPRISYRCTLNIERDCESDTEVEISPRDEKMEDWNEYQKLLRLPEREQITWPSHYLQPEQEHEKDLVRRAEDCVDKIVEDFCQFMKELDGNLKTGFSPKEIKEMFQVRFESQAERGLRIIMKELPCLPDNVAGTTGFVEQSRSAALDRLIKEDIKAEQKPDIQIAFDKFLPRKDRWKAPKNDVKNEWRLTKSVPKDLITLKTVWEDITNLKSVKEYCRWMIEHPEHRKAPYLSSLGMFDTAVLDARQDYESRYKANSAYSALYAAKSESIMSKFSSDFAQSEKPLNKETPNH